MIEIERPPPFATIQDLGWKTGRAIGLPRSGAMDPLMLGLANSLAGNPPGAAGIEWALGAGAIRTLVHCELVVLGAGQVLVGGSPADPAHPVIQTPAGTRVEILPRSDHRFLYVAVRGGIDVPQVMGSRSTYLPGSFGGFEGRRLRSGDLVPVGPAMHSELGGSVHPRISLSPAQEDVTVRVSPGPQWARFDERARETLLEGRFTVSAASDRMGYRLDGPAIISGGSATLPSEAACPGAIQIPDGGQPIVIMPDGPTVGGYPKIAVVLAADLRLLAQCLPGRGVQLSYLD